MEGFEVPAPTRPTQDPIPKRGCARARSSSALALSDRAFVVDVAKRRGFGSVAAYLRDLVRQSGERDPESAASP